MVTTEVCDDIVEQLRRITRVHRHTQRRPGHEHAAAMGVLGVLAAAGPLRAGDLAERVLVDSSVISRQVAELADAGLLTRQADPCDGRSRLLGITPHGQAVLTEHRARSTRLLADRLADWDESEARTLAALLARLHTSVTTTSTATTSTATTSTVSGDPA